MNTDFLFGYAGAFLKICALAVAVMAVVWGIGKLSVILHERRRRPADGDGGD